ncbi:hypothetical protein Tco_0834917 [Tanacetum coccineum]
MSNWRRKKEMSKELQGCHKLNKRLILEKTTIFCGTRHKKLPCLPSFLNRRHKKHQALKTEDIKNKKASRTKKRIKGSNENEDIEDTSFVITGENIGPKPNPAKGFFPSNTKYLNWCGSDLIEDEVEDEDSDLEVFQNMLELDDWFDSDSVESKVVEVLLLDNILNSHCPMAAVVVVAQCILLTVVDGSDARVAITSNIRCHFVLLDPKNNLIPILCHLDLAKDLDSCAAPILEISACPHCTRDSGSPSAPNVVSVVAELTNLSLSEDVGNMTTSSANNSVFRDFFEKQKLTRPNFIDWYRQLRIVLSIEDKLNYLEQPIPPAPVAPKGQLVASEITAAHTAWIKGSKEIAGLMIMTIEPEIQRNLENLHAHEMLEELKTLFAQQSISELLSTIARFFTPAKQEEGIPYSTLFI